MPSRNSIKIYVENGFYHIYNRGVEKRTIFEDAQDYKVFLKYLKEALSSPQSIDNYRKLVTFKGASFKGMPRLPKNFEKEIVLLAYCLLPNHFHLLIKQSNKSSMESFMRSVITRYSMYFNKRYHRVGKLFQGHYKACSVTDENYLLHLTRYIHLNPKEFNSKLTEAYSSYADYLGIRDTIWIKPEPVLFYFNQADKSLFKSVNTYKDFVEGKLDSGEIIKELILES